MRTTHWGNPLHRIERWTGTYFRSAELWEVGTYVLIPHHQGEPMCDALERQQQTLEQFEHQKDAGEQEKLGRSATARHTTRPPARTNGPGTADMEWDRPGVEPEDPFDDEHFGETLDRLHRRLHVVDDDGGDEAVDDFEFFTEEDDETVVEEADADISLPQYLPEQTEDGSLNVPTRDLFNNSYVRIVHTNGLHHLAMVSCQCRGAALLPCDLMASGLVPASFQRIRTLFSIHLLDFFRLCNLEMKASAYQFYHLLRRLTAPTAPAEVVDLYNEFRRMSRLWRWMKKLKWAGYGHNGKNPTNVAPGELANYCPACPQPGINLPEDWKDDPNRCVAFCLSHTVGCSIRTCRFAFRRIITGDGNYKADHVAQPPASNEKDAWLGEGGGMMPSRAEYHAFLETAMEKQTVRTFSARRHGLCSSLCEESPLREHIQSNY